MAAMSTIGQRGAATRQGRSRPTCAALPTARKTRTAPRCRPSCEKAITQPRLRRLKGLEACMFWIDTQGARRAIRPWKSARPPLREYNITAFAEAKGFARWHGARGGLSGQSNNRAVIGRGQGSLQAARRASRSFAHNLDRGACAGHGCAGATCTSDTAPCRRQSGQAQTDRRRHPAGGRGGRIWLYLRAIAPRSDGPHREAASFVRVMFRRRVTSIAPQRAAKL